MQKIYLCRHGQTPWNISEQHTSYTDMPLTEMGIKQAKLLKNKLKNKKFEKVFTSPLSRAKETCELAGFKGVLWDDLKEWNYGDYEGLTTKEIQKKIPDWTVFLYGCENGESIENVTKRAVRVIEKLREIKQDTLLFSHGHFTRVLCACWIGFSAREGRFFASSNASMSILGYEHQIPLIRVLNDTSHLLKD